MIYELHTNDFGETYVKRQNPNGTTSWIPTSKSNKDYREYLRYTEWVEAGNNPEEFWSQFEDFLDTSVPEQPKEEGEV